MQNNAHELISRPREHTRPTVQVAVPRQVTAEDIMRGYQLSLADDGLEIDLVRPANSNVCAVEIAGRSVMVIDLTQEL